MIAPDSLAAYKCPRKITFVSELEKGLGGHAAGATPPPITSVPRIVKELRASSASLRPFG